MKRYLFAKARHDRHKEQEALRPFRELEFDGFKLDDRTLELVNRISSRNWRPGKSVDLPPGFTRSRAGTSYHVYVGENFVVKKPLTCGAKPKNACPTLMLKNDWRVQPVVQVYRHLAKEIKKELEKSGKTQWDSMKEGMGSDCHSGNFGLLGKELVQFDW